MGFELYKRKPTSKIPMVFINNKGYLYINRYTTEEYDLGKFFKLYYDSHSKLIGFEKLDSMSDDCYTIAKHHQYSIVGLLRKYNLDLIKLKGGYEPEISESPFLTFQIDLKKKVLS